MRNTRHHRQCKLKLLVTSRGVISTDLKNESQTCSFIILVISALSLSPMILLQTKRQHQFIWNYSLQQIPIYKALRFTLLWMLVHHVLKWGDILSNGQIFVSCWSISEASLKQLRGSWKILTWLDCWLSRLLCTKKSLILTNPIFLKIWGFFPVIHFIKRGAAMCFWDLPTQKIWFLSKIEQTRLVFKETLAQMPASHSLIFIGNVYCWSAQVFLFFQRLEHQYN